VLEFAWGGYAAFVISSSTTFDYNPLLHLTSEIDPTLDEQGQIVDFLGPFCRRHPELYAERVPGLINVMNVKGSVAASYAREAIRLDAVLRNLGFPSGVEVFLGSPFGHGYWKR
jgi:hypothetical protein